MDRVPICGKFGRMGRHPFVENFCRKLLSVTSLPRQVFDKSYRQEVGTIATKLLESPNSKSPIHLHSGDAWTEYPSVGSLEYGPSSFYRKLLSVTSLPSHCPLLSRSWGKGNVHAS